MKIVSFKLPEELYSDLEELARVYARGDRSEFLRMLITREVGRLRCPVLFLAGSGTAIDAAIGSGIKPLNWLLSAGTYYRGGKFRESTDFDLARSLGGLLFMDSGAQQFYRDFKGFDYPYSDKEYLEFALRVGVDYIATLDLPLDILHPRGLPIKDGIKRTVEHGVELIALAEDLGVVDKVVPVLQGFNDPSQWLESLDLYKSHGVIPQRFRYWGVGSICMMKSPPLVHKVLSAVRQAMPNARIHVFGISMNSLKRVYHMINSYDTSVWVYHAKMDGRVYVWDPADKAFMRLKVGYVHAYGTEKLMRANLTQILTMHEDLCTRLTTYDPGKGRKTN
jgi:queuine/archaeosine tRNA-ribosyltransferase